MRRALGLLTGAGISAAAPAGLPLGDELHRQVIDACHGAAQYYLPTIRADCSDRIANANLNVLGRLHASAGRAPINHLLSTLKVLLPNESHLLVAVATMNGALHVTLNFDDGVERAYRLLSGREELPTGVPSRYERCLRAWRRRLSPVPPLQLVLRPHDLERSPSEPVLVKFRGSLSGRLDGTLVPLLPVVEDLEPVHLDSWQVGVFRALAGAEHVALVGVSGRDLDCRLHLLPRLRSGHFDWIDPGSAGALSRGEVNDRATAVAMSGDQYLRTLDADLAELPEWPTGPVLQPDYATRLAHWRSKLPPEPAAETYAWLLTDAGLHSDALALLRAIVTDQQHPRLILRLADALRAEASSSSNRKANELYRRVVVGPRTPGRYRRYALLRLGEFDDGGDVPCGASPAMIITQLAAAVGHDERIGAAAWTTLAESCCRWLLTAMFSQPGRFLLPGLAERATLDATRRALGLAAKSHSLHRRGRLLLLRDELVVLANLRRHQLPPRDLVVDIQRTAEAYRCRGDKEGLRAALAVQALAAAASGRIDPVAVHLEDALRYLPVPCVHVAAALLAKKRDLG